MKRPMPRLPLPRLGQSSKRLRSQAAPGNEGLGGRPKTPSGCKSLRRDFPAGPLGVVNEFLLIAVVTALLVGCADDNGTQVDMDADAGVAQDVAEVAEDVVEPFDGACNLMSDPPEGSWQGEINPLLDCTCTPGNSGCHGVHVARVESISRNKATVLFKMAGGSAPATQLDYWLVSLSDAQLDCNLLSFYAVRSVDSWNPSEGELVISLDVWPNELACEDAPSGDAKYVGLITGSGDDPQGKIWFTPTAISFTRR